MKKCLAMLAVVTAAFLSISNPPEAAASPKCDAKIPSVTVKTADDSSHAALLGVWQGGAWDGELCAHLAVVEINGKKAEVIYAWGTAPRWTYPVMRSGDVRLTADITADGEIVFYSRKTGAKYSFRLEGDDLVGKWSLRGDTYRIALTKKN